MDGFCASHPAAPGSILSVPDICIHDLEVADGAGLGKVDIGLTLLIEPN